MRAAALPNGLRLSGFYNAGWYAANRPRRLGIVMGSFEHTNARRYAAIPEGDGESRTRSRRAISIAMDRPGFVEIRQGINGWAALARVDRLDPDRALARQFPAPSDRRRRLLVRLAAESRRPRRHQRAGALRSGRRTSARESAAGADAHRVLAILVASAILSGMQTHTNRLVVAAVLIAAGVAGGFFVLTAQRRMAALDAAGADISSRIQRMIVTAGDIASAQQAYVAPGQPEQPWLERAAMLLQQFGEEAAALRPLLQSTDAAAALDQADKNFRSSVVVDGKASAVSSGRTKPARRRSDLQRGARHDCRARDDDWAASARRSRRRATARIALVERQQWVTITLVAGLWLVGLMALVPLPRSAIRDSGIAGLEFSSPEFRIPNRRASRRARIACFNRSRGGRGRLWRAGVHG